MTIINEHKVEKRSKFVIVFFETWRINEILSRRSRCRKLTNDSRELDVHFETNHFLKNFVKAIEWSYVLIVTSCSCESLSRAFRFESASIIVIFWLHFKNSRCAAAALAVCKTSFKIIIWLILSVVICLFQKLNHACLSINNYTMKLRMTHYISYRLFDNILLHEIFVIILKLIHVKNLDFEKDVFIK